MLRHTKTDRDEAKETAEAFLSAIASSDYELEANIIVDGVALELDIEIVRNDLGYGIYSFEIDSND